MVTATVHPSEQPAAQAGPEPAREDPAPPTAPTISVIVPVHNGGSSFRQCLAHLKALSPAPDEIIVVADGPSDGSWQAATELATTVVHVPTTGGPARARNVGAQVARGDVLFFLDADVAVHPDAVRQIVAVFRAEPELAAVFGSYDDTPAAPNFLSQYRNLLHHYVHQHSHEQAATFWTGCGAIRRQVFATLGGLDESYRQPSIEDIELGYRLVRAGYRIRLCKTLLGTHLKTWQAGSLLKADLLLRAVPWTELILRDRRFLNDLNLRHESRASVVLTYAALGGLVAAGWSPWGAAMAAGCLVTMWALNARLLSFFARRRGGLFALAVLPWFTLFQLYSGLGFAMGLVRYATR